MFPARVFAAALLLTSSGCMLMQPMKEISDSMKKSLRLNPRDYRQDETGSEWAGAASEARGNQKRERDFDPFWNFYDPRTREINRNLGIEN